MDILMPKLGLTMTEGTLTEWSKQPGDPVHQGEILFLFESEKATMEYEAPADGVLERILVETGTTVACGVPVAILATGPALDAGPAAAPETPTVIATPAAKRRARELGVDLATLAGRGPEGRVQLADVEEARRGERAWERGSKEAEGRPAGRPYGAEWEATPVARRLAQDLGVELAGIQGSGPGGRIGRDDVLAAVRRTLAACPAPSPEPDRPLYADRTTLAGVRRVIAQRMSESAFTAPHVTLHTEADATSLVTARRQINEELAGESKISYNALLVALVARALREHPALNACLVEDEIRIYEAVNIALAVDTERGLLVPVIRDADRLDLVGIQQAGDALIQRALAGASLPDDFSDGTFTITNLGMYEIDGFTPIINQPQSAILGVGRIVSKPVDVGGQVGLRQVMTLSLSFDHRIVDGGPAARFLQRVKQLVERPFTLALPTSTNAMLTNNMF